MPKWPADRAKASPVKRFPTLSTALPTRTVGMPETIPPRKLARPIAIVTGSSMTTPRPPANYIVVDAICKHALPDTRVLLRYGIAGSRSGVAAILAGLSKHANSQALSPCRRKIEKSLGAQSRNDTPVAADTLRATRHVGRELDEDGGVKGRSRRSRCACVPGMGTGLEVKVL